MPKAQWKSKTRNLLPDDKHFNSRQLLRLFLKPKARMGSCRAGSTLQAPSVPTEEVDEAYWANAENNADAGAPGEEGVEGNYNANFFNDDALDMPGGDIDDDEDDFADAREHFSPALEGMDGGPDAIAGVLGTQPDGAFGAQLVTQSRRLRPEYMQYARVAKKVDVRRLKEELWRGIGFKEVSDIPILITIIMLT
jgi:condensin complex subunit 2